MSGVVASCSARAAARGWASISFSRPSRAKPRSNARWMRSCGAAWRKSYLSFRDEPRLCRVAAISAESDIVSGGETRGVGQARAGILESESGRGDCRIHDAARCMYPVRRPRKHRRRAAVRQRRRSGKSRGYHHAARQRRRSRSAGAEQARKDADAQTFRFDEILRAYEGDLTKATDDCSLYLAAGYVPHFVFVTGEAVNQKLTSAEDWQLALATYAHFGTGFDTHQLVEGRKLILGGVEIQYEKGLLGHSDADV